MTLRPIDFVSAIFNIQRVEKVQANKTEHNFVLQDYIAKELHRERRENRNKVVQTEETRGLQVNDRKERQKEEKKKASTYDRRMRKKDDGEGEILDVEV